MLLLAADMNTLSGEGGVEERKEIGREGGEDGQRGGVRGRKRLEGDVGG